MRGSGYDSHSVTRAEECFKIHVIKMDVTVL